MVAHGGREIATIYIIYRCLLILPTLANILLHTDEEVSVVGSTLRLNCSLEALNQTHFSPINITWYRNETALVGVRTPILLGATSSTLVLRDVQFNDSGTYSCSLIEAQTSARIEINVGLPPEPATALKCSSSDFDNSICTWNRGGQHSNLLTEDSVERVRDRESEWKVCTENSKGVSTTQSICNQTTCYVVCYKQGMGAKYRVNSTNLLGTNYSGDIYFNIDEETIPNPPLDIKVQNESATSLLITWTPDPGVASVSHQHLVTYTVKYRWEGEEKWSKVKGLNKNEVLLTGLRNPYGLYFVKVKCSSHYQTDSKYSRVVSGRTSEEAPVDKPRNFSCVSEILERTGRRNINLSWELLPDKFKRNGEITDLIIRVRQMVNTSAPAEVRIVGPNVTSYTLEDMELEEKYEITMRLRNSVRQSGNYSLCTTEPNPSGSDLSVSLTVACVGSICLFAAIFWTGFKFYKKVMKGIPNFQLPPHFGNSNLYFSARSPHRTLTQEKEVYNELLTGDSLFVDLPAEKTPFDSPGVSPGPNNNLAFSVTFDIGNTPQENVESFPRGKVDELDIPFSSLPPTEREAHRSRHWSSETCTSSLNSPISVGSGGSYFVLRESDSTSYCVLAKDGFSPAKENNRQDQDLSGVGASGGLTPCLDLETDSDGEVSILGFESKKKSGKFGSPEGILYTRKHVLPTLSDSEVSQQRSLRASTDCPMKSRDTVGLFGLDEVTEEQETESIGSILENDDDIKENGSGENGDEAEIDLGLAGTPEKLQDINKDAVLNIPPEKVQDENEDVDIKIPTEKVQEPNEDDGVKIPSENAQISVDDIEEGGGAIAGQVVENASLRHTDQPDFILNYITVCKDDDGSNEEEIDDEEVKTEIKEDEMTITTGSSSNHIYPGSSNGTYIDQAQLASISPVSSPTRLVNHHDFNDL
ncbi:uncharacterized protein [Asterias amurensis]|uniref:uncharacterized protein n=1 Tax=Asterias amurensis TaxID=7602 RepID=UPI003AB30A9B